MTYISHQYSNMTLLNIKEFIEKLKLFLYYVGTDKQFVRKRTTNMESLQITLGTNHHIVKLLYEKYGIMAPISWISTLWQISYEYNEQLVWFNEQLHPGRVNDKAPMDMIIESEIFAHVIKQINHCRMHLQIWNLSDIIDSSEVYNEHCAIHHI